MTTVEVAAEKNILPIASARATWRHVVTMFHEERSFVSVVIGIQVVASAAGLVGPQILEFLIDHVRAHQGSSTIDFAAGLFLGALVVQTVLTGAARALGAVLGERLLARLREQLVSSVLNLPLGLVERAGNEDLLTPVFTDVY